jgi:ligand-binding SRPBCC domain-containing protein
VTRIDLVTPIAAPPERCFDLARSVEAHVRSSRGTRERAVAGRTTGLLEPGEEVTWLAVHLGLRFRLTSRITAFDRPRHFQDSMTSGPLKRLVHDHFFAEDGRGGTIMREEFEFEAPGGPLGRLAEWSWLTRHFRRFLARRNRELKALAEADGWKEFLP